MASEFKSHYPVNRPTLLRVHCPTSRFHFVVFRFLALTFGSCFCQPIRQNYVFWNQLGSLVQVAESVVGLFPDTPWDAFQFLVLCCFWNHPCAFLQFEATSQLLASVTGVPIRCFGPEVFQYFEEFLSNLWIDIYCISIITYVYSIDNIHTNLASRSISLYTKGRSQNIASDSQSYKHDPHQ